MLLKYINVQAWKKYNMVVCLPRRVKPNLSVIVSMWAVAEVMSPPKSYRV